jgi:hypothetical protein
MFGQKLGGTRWSLGVPKHAEADSRLLTRAKGMGAQDAARQFLNRRRRGRRVLNRRPSDRLRPGEVASASWRRAHRLRARARPRARWSQASPSATSTRGTSAAPRRKFPNAKTTDFRGDDREKSLGASSSRPRTTSTPAGVGGGSTSTPRSPWPTVAGARHDARHPPSQSQTGRQITRATTPPRRRLVGGRGGKILRVIWLGGTHRTAAGLPRTPAGARAAGTSARARRAAYSPRYHRSVALLRSLAAATWPTWAATSSTCPSGRSSSGTR